MKILLFIGIISFLHFSCNEKDQSEEKLDSSDALKVYKSIGAISKDTKLENIGNCLVIPIDLGCETCIKSALNFTKANTNPSNLVIITSQSANSLTNKLKVNDFTLKDFTSKNIVLDTSNQCFKSQVSDVTPIIYKISDKKAERRIMLYAASVNEQLEKIK
jgi:hypothetical protein